MILANSNADYEPLAHDGATTHFSVYSPSAVTMQSSSVTSAGQLWQWALADMRNGGLTIPSRTTPSDEALRRRRHEALVQLFRSWDEEVDEQEQRETWEELKRALDEDRLSDRKLFP
jgi:hypothetical protein